MHQVLCKVRTSVCTSACTASHTPHSMADLYIHIPVKRRIFADTLHMYLQAHCQLPSLGSPLALTSAGWLRTYSRSGTMQLMPTWAGSPILPQSHRKVWWRSGTCKTGQSHRWQVAVKHRTDGTKCPFDSGMAVCPCDNLAHNHPEVAVEWDWEASGESTPETVAANSLIKAAWRCALCGHRWISVVASRTLRGTGCPQCAREASRIRTKQPSISDAAPHLLAEWDWKANKTHGWHPDRVTLGSAKQVHWVRRDECKLGLVHRWQAAPQIPHF